MNRDSSVLLMNRKCSQTELLYLFLFFLGTILISKTVNLAQLDIEETLPITEYLMVLHNFEPHSALVQKCIFSYYFKDR